MNPAINGSEPLDLQDVSPSPAAQPLTPQERAPNPGKTGSEPQQKKGSTQMFNTKKRFFLVKEALLCCLAHWLKNANIFILCISPARVYFAYSVAHSYLKNSYFIYIYVI